MTEKPPIATRLQALADKLREESHAAHSMAIVDRLLRWCHGAEALASEIEAKAEDIRAHGSHWRQPYQAYCYSVADALAARKEPVETEKETG